MRARDAVPVCALPFLFVGFLAAATRPIDIVDAAQQRKLDAVRDVKRRIRSTGSVPGDRGTVSGRAMRVEGFQRRTLLRRVLQSGLAFAAASRERVVDARSLQQGTTGRVRRVVVGHNAAGRSCVLGDAVVSGTSLWETDPTRPLGALAPDEAAEVRASTRADADPPGRGTRWMAIVMPPSPPPAPTLANRRGFHRVAAVDYVFVTGGTVVLLLDEAEVMLRTGDAVVLRNAMHSWRNDAADPATLVITSVSVAAGR